ncbi:MULTISPECIES: DUF1659 domain-containing protein [Tindallia]|uniref:DUF1659 domain-containing protein n=2 Tax=Tindallia TaxID=69894 RepID=A0A1H3PDP0_9FIRM|nr:MULTISPECIES: DUF1659 domain-containing protein [Tindallia]SDY99177.1 Protein of unknown function [Tindallia californiensis]SFH80694.1 Protein of unknown function [Tindallia magadiensis]
MPVEIANQSSRLRLRFINDIVDGREQLMSRTYSGIKTEAEDSQVLNAAQILSGLQTKPVKTIIRTEEKELIEG